LQPTITTTTSRTTTTTTTTVTTTKITISEEFFFGFWTSQIVIAQYQHIFLFVAEKRLGDDGNFE